MFRTLAVSLLSLLLCASVAFAEKPLVVASDPTFPPNEMLNKDKEIVGFSIDYIKAVGKEAGFDVQVKNIAWDGIFAALASNQVDVIAASVSITDKRKKAMGFSDPYCEMNCIRPWSCRSARKSRISKSLPESGSVARSARLPWFRPSPLPRSR